MNELTSERKQRVLDFLKPPFKHDCRGGCVWDASTKMVGDETAGHMLRVRGWGVIQRQENPEQLQKHSEVNDGRD